MDVRPGQDEKNPSSMTLMHDDTGGLDQVMYRNYTRIFLFI